MMMGLEGFKFDESRTTTSRPVRWNIEIPIVGQIGNFKTLRFNYDNSDLSVIVPNEISRDDVNKEKHPHNEWPYELEFKLSYFDGNMDHSYAHTSLEGLSEILLPEVYETVLKHREEAPPEIRGLIEGL